MSAGTVRIEVGRRDAQIRGPGRLVMPALKLVRCRRQWDSAKLCWLVPVDQVSEVIAAIEHRVGGVVEVVNASQP